MKSHEVNQFLQSLHLQLNDPEPTLLETHISWVILAGDHAYKIKKPVKFDFLDFSTLPKRKYYCEREFLLNKRLAGDMYIAVVAIYKHAGTFRLQADQGELADYAVKMKRMDSTRELDTLIQQKQPVSKQDMTNLARKIARFHQHAQVIHTHPAMDKLKLAFNDINSVKNTADQFFGPSYSALITQAISVSDAFLEQQEFLFIERASQGDIRDVHGDLHTGNIFLYEDPVIFDCLEFNDQLRQMDVLNEVAFLCMDLEAWERQDLSTLFFENYVRFAAINDIDRYMPLFNYYKTYCANIRAKVALLNTAGSSMPLPEQKKQAALRYLNLLSHYLTKLKNQSHGHHNQY
jgi:aminoglycoside phosphotransferase family enzyme